MKPNPVRLTPFTVAAAVLLPVTLGACLHSNPLSDTAAFTMQCAAPIGIALAGTESEKFFPDLSRRTRKLEIPTSIAKAGAVVYVPENAESLPPVHVNFHGGGYIVPGTELDDALCRYLAAKAGVVVVNVDYVLAPEHRFPEPPRQAYEVVRWVAEHGAENGWDGRRLTIGGQSAGGGLAAAVARQALEQGAPAIALQVLHYPPLDLATDPKHKHSPLANPTVKPWMAEIFNNAYVPDEKQRLDRLVSPANAADTADLTGIAPALVITPELDSLHDEGQRYAERLLKVGALVEHRDVPQADHGYDLNDAAKAAETYAVIARRVKEATQRR